MFTKNAPRIQSTAYPPSRLTNEIREGGLWYSEKQNELLLSANKIIAKPKTSMDKLKGMTVKQGSVIFWIIAFGSVITTFIYHLIFI